MVDVCFNWLGLLYQELLICWVYIWWQLLIESFQRIQRITLSRALLSVCIGVKLVNGIVQLISDWIAASLILSQSRTT